MDTSQQNESGCNFQMESHRMVHRFPKRERVFNCADSIESLKCSKCAHFQTHKLVDLKEHFKGGHTLSEKEDKFYCCANCNFQTYSNYLNLRHKLFKLCKGNCIIKSEETRECTNEFLQCDSCEFRTPLKSALDNHFTKKHKSHKDALRKCEHCPYVTKHLKSFKLHILLKHTDPDKLQWFKCEHCPYKSKIRTNFKCHVNYKHGKRERLKCGHCSFETKDKGGLQKHIICKHTDPNKLQWYECEYCSHKTKLKSSLKTHIDRVHNRIEVECDICQFKTNSNQGLQFHIIQKHSDSDTIEWFRCERCPYKSHIKGNLRCHMNNKHAEKEYLKCDSCSFETKYKRCLRNHILLKHADPDKSQWFECEQCSYKTIIKCNLRIHVDCKHNGIKFECDYCQFKANSNKGLKTHILQKHADPDKIQWFKCEKCPYSSPIKTNFTCHMVRTHGKRDRFKCEHCEFGTTQKRSLINHILKKHRSDL